MSFKFFAVIAFTLLASSTSFAQSITDITVTVKQVFARTSSGALIAIPSSGQQLDLANMAESDGVSLTLPGSGSVEVTELVLKLKGGHREVNFDTGDSCKLRSPNTLILVSPAPLLLESGVPYVVHAAFSSLSIEEKGKNLRCELGGNQFEITGVEFGG